MNEVATQPLRQVQSVKALLHNTEAKQQLAAVAAKHMSPERLMRVTANAIRTTPKLQQCEPLSFLGALMQCASLGLEANTVLGHAYLIPFENSRKIDGKWVKIPEVQVIIGYKGLIDLARRSGHITSISAHVHYDDDELWEYEEGTEARLRHIPGPEEGKPLHAYAIAKFVEGGHAYVVLPWAKVMKVRNGSQGWQSAVKYGKTEKSPWFTHEDAMAKKTAIRALSKYLPLSVEFSEAVQVDNDSGSRVDYARFATAPEDGATIDGDFIEEDHDPDTGEVTEAEDPKPEPKRQKEPVKTQTKPEPKEEPEKPKQEEAKPEDTPKQEETAKDFGPLLSALKGDLLDAGTDNIDEVLDFYGPQIEEMKLGSPDLHADLKAHIEELRKAPVESGEA